MSKPFIVIELDKHRNLRYGYRALIQLEQMMGKNLTQIDMGNLSLKDTNNIILLPRYPLKFRDLVNLHLMNKSRN